MDDPEWHLRRNVKSVLVQARLRAERVGVPFALTYDNLPPCPSVCPVLGIPMARSGAKSNSNTPSLDRIVPELGYVPGNVQWISYRANSMKRDASPSELRKFANWVLDMYPDEEK